MAKVKIQNYIEPFVSPPVLQKGRYVVEDKYLGLLW